MTDLDPTERTQAPSAPLGASSRVERRATPALVKTMALAAVLTLASIGVLAADLPFIHDVGRDQIPWWALAIGFAVAEKLVFHIEFRREVISFSLSEIPLTLALFFASPMSLVVGRFVGEFVVLVVLERQQVRKTITNLSSFLAECVTALVVFYALHNDHDLTSPVTWASAAAAVIAADLLGMGAVMTVMDWHGAPVARRKMLMTTMVTAISNTSLAVMAAVLLHANQSAVVLLGLMTVMVVMAYRGYSALSRRYSNLELLYDFTRLVSGSKQPEVMLASVLKETKRMLRADAAGIITLGSGESLSLWLGPDDDMARQRQLPVAALRLLVSSGRSVVINQNERDPDRRAVLDALGVTDCIVAQIIESSVAIGVILVADRETAVSTFDAEDGRIFETLAAHAGMALENGRLIDRLHEQARQREHEALHDPLTELPNRANFLRRLSAGLVDARADGRPLGVALLDLDHFKEVNDTLGHHYGDLLLKEVADRLRSTLPPAVTVARLGGDEFALFIHEDVSREHLQDMGRAIQVAFTHPFMVEGLRLDAGVSIGFALSPDHGSDPSTLMQRADVAMYDAKAASTTRIEIYEADRDANSPRRLALTNDLRDAIESKELALHYQPKAILSDCMIGGVEALIRWRHPVYGNVPPDDFVPLAERTGLIHPFTDFVVSEGIQQLHRWSASGIDMGMSMNLSMRNLLDITLPDRVAASIDAIGVDPSRITFEVTESSMMADPAKTLSVLHGLARVGVRLSIDDFGTGHSSLAYLQRLPVHEVKIDKSFVMPITSDHSSRAIVQSIIQLAHNLGLTVVAEGVEDEDTWDELCRLGCDEAQGYFLCRPVAPDALVEWIDARSSIGR